MYSIKDAVLDHAKKVEHGGSTGQCIEFLELPNDYRYNAAGNLYLSALSIINAAQQSMHLTAYGRTAWAFCAGFVVGLLACLAVIGGR